MAADEYAFLGEMTQEEELLFKRSIRTLLDRTFILEERDRKLYDYLASGSNQVDVSRYLRLIGYDIMVDEKTKVAMLTPNEEDLDTTGLKQINLQRFNRAQVELLLILWQLYQQHYGFENQIYVTQGDIVDNCRIHQIEMKPGVLKDALRMMKHYSLIDYREDDLEREDAAIRLYPSLQFCMDRNQLDAVVKKLQKEEQDIPEETKEEDEEGDDE